MFKTKEYLQRHTFFKLINALILCLLLTRFGGFVAVAPVVFNFTLILYLLIFSVIMLLKKSFIFKKKYIGISFFLFFFYCYGLLKPVWDDNSTFYYSLKESRHFIAWLLLPLWLYFLSPRKPGTGIDLSWIWIFVGFACYLSVVNFVFYLFGIKPPGYAASDSGLLHLAAPTLLIVGLFLVWVKAIVRGRGLNFTDILFSTIIILAISIEGHRALFLGLLIAILIFIYLKFNNRFSFGLKLSVLLLVFIGFLIVWPYAQSLLIADAAFQSRFAINAMRFDYFLTQMSWGYGFIDENSELGLQMSLTSASRFQDTFGTVDFGYLDIALKFGLVGGTLFLFYFLWFASKALLSRESLSQLAGSFIFGLFFMNLTWSMFTYPHGIIITTLLAAIIILHRNDGSSPLK